MKYVSLAIALLICSTAIAANSYKQPTQPSAPYTEESIGKDNRRMAISTFAYATSGDIEIDEEGEPEEGGEIEISDAA